MKYLPNSHRLRHWDIFCTVIDNYGDIGVTWRLARQLYHEFAIPIRLWVDDLTAFSHILPTLDPDLEYQWQQGVEIIRWCAPLSFPYEPGEAVIEAFACTLPDSVINAIKDSKNAASTPVWLNLEYLSAEDWVSDCHGLPSFQHGLKKHFYFPGFGAGTGGLICEAELYKQRETFRQEQKSAFLNGIGVDLTTDPLIVSLFSYESPAIEALCKSLMRQDTATAILLPKGRGLTSVLNAFGGAFDTQVGSINRAGALSVHLLPLTDQQGFDRLLWATDINVVRGEDSFVRAQWAAMPFLWHIYAQEDDAHLVKLDAFMAKYAQKLPLEAAKAWRAANLALNTHDSDGLCNAWQHLISVKDQLVPHAQRWPTDALTGADLATRLVQFVKSR